MQGSALEAQRAQEAQKWEILKHFIEFLKARAISSVSMLFITEFAIVFCPFIHFEIMDSAHISLKK